MCMYVICYCILYSTLKNCDTRILPTPEFLFSKINTLRCLIVAARLLLRPCWTYPPWWSIKHVFFQFSPSRSLLGPCFLVFPQSGCYLDEVIQRRTVFLGPTKMFHTSKDCIFHRRSACTFRFSLQCIMAEIC